MTTNVDRERIKHTDVVFISRMRRLGLSVVRPEWQALKQRRHSPIAEEWLTVVIFRNSRATSALRDTVLGALVVKYLQRWNTKHVL